MNSIPYGRQDISDTDIAAVIETLKSDFLTQGPKIQEFEEAFARYIGVEYAVAVSNGTAALHLCALALGVNNQSKVITTPITFAASANCIKYCGGEVTLVDIDPETGLIDVDKARKVLEQADEGEYKGIIPVDFAGLAVNLEEVRKLADEYKLWIIEDACHAPGGYFVDGSGEKQFCGNGNYADLAIFSFHPVKHIATGEGGMITTNDPELYEKLLLLRTHGITKDADLLKENHGGWYYEMQELGYNYRLSDMQAALGITQLKRAKSSLEKRRAIALRYDKAFDGTNILPLKGDAGHAYHLYVIQGADRKGLYEYLRDNKIFAQVHYIPLHLMPFYQDQGYKIGDFPIAEAYYKKCLSLPMYPTLTEEEQDFVIEKVKGFYSL
ncbi:UDP-4-amino-4,6-dideoxy-N-acetyl-beta-L-altrosamine transaminase [Flexithrix dorotheae]|uniref:UDP-4-amino-4, 6-dideoxy-N-acetyl-beta-L-altrosamine transaminase n=1 Tax=Flexithrix dorotheae TaxID=70993 RepID=UPI0003773531|nr:UDP-4-amino-4,6-dideoxy-N-acetyl-beta-L-altrosamine transaminase [Flexithrix dorotheae]